MSIDESKNLFLNMQESDVILQIRGIELPAHRSILSERSEYFKAMFSSSFIEASSNKITLNETDLKTFLYVLKYIYTGTLEHLHNAEITTEFFEVLTCSRFYMVDGLSKEMISHIKNSKSVDFQTLLKYAFDYDVDDLTSYCTEFIKKGKRRFGTWTFDKLSPSAVEYLLQLRLDAEESHIFGQLVCWMRQNPKYSSVFPKLLKHIDLYLLDAEHLAMLSKPIQLIDRSFYQNLLNQQQIMAKQVQKIVDQNVINGTDDLRIVDGVKYSLDRSDKMYLAASLKNTIIVDLKRQFLLNCFKLKLDYDTSYIVYVSRGMHDWKRVIDHSKYQCSGPQVLYFKERDFRFFCIQIVKGSHVNVNIEAMYSTNIVETDPNTTLIVPNENVVPTKMLYKWKSDTVGCLIRGIPDDSHVEHMIGSQQGIIYKFYQPYIIGSVKLLLNEESSYCIEISTNNETFIRVFAEEDVVGWRIATFPRQPVMFIKIVGTKAPSAMFRLHKLECPATKNLKRIVMFVKNVYCYL